MREQRKQLLRRRRAHGAPGRGGRTRSSASAIILFLRRVREPEFRWRALGRPLFWAGGRSAAAGLANTWPSLFRQYDTEKPMNLFRLGVGVSLVVRAARDPAGRGRVGFVLLCRRAARVGAVALRRKGSARGRAAARRDRGGGARGSLALVPRRLVPRAGALRSRSDASRQASHTRSRPWTSSGRAARGAFGLAARRGRRGAGLEEHVLPDDRRPRARRPRHRRRAAALGSCAPRPSSRWSSSPRCSSPRPGSPSARSRCCATTPRPGRSSASSPSAAGGAVELLAQPAAADAPRAASPLILLVLVAARAARGPPGPARPLRRPCRRWTPTIPSSGSA